MNFAFYVKYITAAYIILNVFRRKTQMRVSKNTHTQTSRLTQKTYVASHVIFVDYKLTISK